MRRYHIITVSIVTALIISSLPQNVSYAEEEQQPVLIETYAEEDMEENSSNTGYLSLDYQIDSIEPMQVNSLEPQAAGYPVSYDARTEKNITSVKNQGIYGTCWAFAAVNSAEADAVKDSRADVNTVDYSEAQLAYFFYHRRTDPLGGTVGDEVTASKNYLTIGGNNQLTTLALASWISPSEEAVMPYEAAGSYNSGNVTDNMAYSSCAEHLQNSYWISMADRDIIKEMILNYGSVATCYYSTSTLYHEINGGCYYFCPFSYTQNHAVSIVGWDDSIPAGNFSCTINGTQYTPSENGGWLVKNSYGSDWGDDGYFWISYSDGSFLNSQAMGVVYDYESVDNYDNNYQYDGTVSLERLQYKSLNSCYVANVFTTQAAEDLKAVGFYTTQPDMQYEIQIYRNLPGGSPIGTSALSTPVSGTAEYAGYHTVSLNTPIALNAGETYSVVVKYTSKTAGVTFFIDKSTSYNFLTCTSSNQSGQSYYGWDGIRWTDSSVEHGANIRVKAFTTYRYNSGGVKPNVTPTSGITLDKMACTLEAGKTMKLTATVLPAQATDQTVQWSSSDSSVVTVDASGHIMAKKEGTAIITARTRAGGHIATCRITVDGLTKAFCARLYEKCLGRQPDSQGLEEWNQRLISGEQSGAEVAYGFVFSDEYKNKHTSDDAYVEMLYQVFLNRGSDPSGKADWLHVLNQGVSREYVFRGFVESQEYSQLCNSYGIVRGSYTLTQPRDQNLGVTSFVSRLYQQALNRAPDDVGLNDWCNKILTKQMSPEEVAECFINSQEFEGKHLSDTEYVKVLYWTFLGREAEPEGLNNWVQQLATGASREEILHGFSRSPEFRQIMAQYGL